jgi:flagellin-like protein
MKKGISEVVATVLIILITVAAITLIWTVIIPMVRENLSYEQNKIDLIILTTEGYTLYDPNTNITCLQIKRGNDNLKLEGIQFIFEYAGESDSVQNNSVPKPNEAEVYCFKDNWNRGKPDSISIAPVMDDKIQQITSKITNVPVGDLKGAVVPVQNIPFQKNADADGDGFPDAQISCHECSSLGEYSCNGAVLQNCTNISGCRKISNLQTCAGATPVCSAVNKRCECNSTSCGAGMTCNSNGQCVPQMTERSVSTCMDLDQPNSVYTLNEDLGSADLNGRTDSCIKITANNIVFDCGGYTLAQVIYGNPVISTDKSNVEIRNCKINVGGEGRGNAIDLIGATNAYIHDNELYGGAYSGIRFYDGYGLSVTGGRIENNNIYDNSHGILFDTGNHTNNNITGNTFTSNSYDGISLSGSENLVQDNIFSENSGPDYGALTLRNAHNNRIIDNVFSDNHGDAAIQFGASPGSSDSNNNEISGGSYSNNNDAFLFLSGSGNTVHNILGISDITWGWFAVEMYGGSDNVISNITGRGNIKDYSDASNNVYTNLSLCESQFICNSGSSFTGTGNKFSSVSGCTAPTGFYTQC